MGALAERSMSRRGLLFPLSRPEQRPELVGPIQIGQNLEITPMLTGHGVEHWETSGQELLEMLEPFTYVIPEYFPPEFRHLERDLVGSFLVGHYRDSNHLFYELADNMLAKQKNVWVLDPAYSMDFAQYRLAYAALPPFAFAANLYLGTKALTRRHWISAAVTSYAAIKLHPFYEKWAYVNLEDDVRNVLVAEALKKLDEQVQEGTKAALIYTHGHWREIAKYLKDDAELKKGLERVESLRRVFPTFFETRNYSAVGGRWEKVGGFKV